MNCLCIEELAEIIHGRLQLGSLPPLGGAMEPIQRVVADVRDVQPGDVFWAVASEPHSDARRAEEAFDRGALGVVAADRRIEPWAGKFSILVEDARWALWQLAAWSRRQFSGEVIAVTGDVGKTTTQRMIESVLAARLDGMAAERRARDAVQLPLALLALDQTCDYGIFEYGSCDAAEFSALSDLCRPGIAVINCLAAAPWSEVDAEKAKDLLASVAADGWAVLDGDIPRVRRWAQQAPARVLLVGRGAHCDVIARQVHSQCGQLSFTVDQTRFRVPVWGRHPLRAALAACAVGRILELPPEEIAAALARFRAPARRCQVLRREAVSVIDDTYDNRATSLLAALEVLRDIEYVRRRIVVCGDLTGAGHPVELHRRAGRAIVQTCGADLLVTWGRWGQAVAAGAQEAGMRAGRTACCGQSERVAEAVRALVRPQDAVLVKGSRTAAMEGVVDALLEDPAAVGEPMAA